MTQHYHRFNGVEPVPGPADGARVLLLFVDGLGLAPASDDNPLAATGATPRLSELLGGPLTAERLGTAAGPGWLLRSLDANLGVGGLPQSATGQTSLFTGVNAQEQLGFHVTAYPGPRLVEIIERHSLWRRVVEADLATTFANAYSTAYLELLASGKRRESVTTCAVRSAGLPLRDIDHLVAGQAVAWDICRDLFGQQGDLDLEPVTPQLAGQHLAGVAAAHRLTVFETFLTDLAGHRRFDLTAAEALRRLDGLVGGLLDHLPGDLTVLLTSDHGNIEVAAHRRHTVNPVPLLALGPGAAVFAEASSLLDVAPCILRLLAVE